jgi:predicted GH43/DUF377 family glycosyl hydrolase
MATLNLQRTQIVLRPDNSRVFFRPFDMPTRDRLMRVLSRVMALSEDLVAEETERTLHAFDKRHQRLREFLLRRFADVQDELPTDQTPSEDRKLLIGAYLTLEYSLEAAALFNPSVVRHPDQTEVPEGSLRLVLSLRATGEGHLSSIVFRTAEMSADGQISVNSPTRFVTAATPYPHLSYDKRLFDRKLAELGLLDNFASETLAELKDAFTLDELQAGLNRGLWHGTNASREQRRHTARDMIALAQANYELRFDPESRLSERVIFPSTPAERRGIEDARWVAFHEEDGSVIYYATCSAYDGHIVLSQLIETRDFLNFRVSTLSGSEIHNKGMALFPRKIDGRYAMISRQDGENIFIMFSDSVYFWREKRILLRPTEPWEFIQLGNCGSPIETEAGWLLLTHGVGTMRRYVIGAALLDRDDPTRVIGRLREPLLAPSESEREGYVPNVVYSCGGIVHEDVLLVPYAMSDQSSSFVTMPLAELLAELKGHA